MPKEEWGVKRICPTTGRRFYDLNKTPIVSPYTGEEVVLDANTKTRVAEVAKEDVKTDELLDDEAEVLLDDDDETDPDVDDDLLDDDDEDDVSLEDIADVAVDDDDS